MIAKLTITPTSKIDNGTPSFDDDKKIEVDFNPEQLTLSGSAHWSYLQAAGQSQRTLQHSQGSSVVTLQMILTFDTSEPDPDGDGDMPSLPGMGGDQQLTTVRTKSDKIAKLMLPEGPPAASPSASGSTLTPPVCRIMWGQNLLLIGVLTIVRQQFTYFGPDGTPLRVKLDCTFTEWHQAPSTPDRPEPEHPQNRSARLAPGPETPGHPHPPAASPAPSNPGPTSGGGGGTGNSVGGAT